MCKTAWTRDRLRSFTSLSNSSRRHSSPLRLILSCHSPMEQEEFFNLTKSITTISTDAKADGSRSNPWELVVPMDTSKGNATTPMIWARNQGRLVFATELLRLLGIDMQGDERALEDHPEKFLLSLTPTLCSAFGLAPVLTVTFVSAPTQHLRAVDEPEETQASSTESPTF